MYSDESRTDASSLTGEDFGSTFVGGAFSLSLPVGWENETFYQLRRADAERLRIEASVDSDLKTSSDVEYAQCRVDVQLQVLRQGQVLTTQILQLEGGGTGYRVLISWREGQQMLFQDQLFVVRNETGYRLAITMTRGERLRLQSQIFPTFRSFRPRRPFQVRGREGLSVSEEEASGQE